MPLFEKLEKDPDYKNYINSLTNIHILFSKILNCAEEYQQYRNNPQKDVTESLCDYFKNVPIFAKELDLYAGSIGITRLSLYLFDFLRGIRIESQTAFKNYLYYILSESPTILLPMWHYQQNIYTPDDCYKTLDRKLMMYYGLTAHLLSKNRDIYMLDISGTTCNAIHKATSLLSQGTTIKIINEVPIKSQYNGEFMGYVCDITKWQQILSSDIKSEISILVSSRFWFWDGFVVSKGITAFLGQISSLNPKIFITLGPFKCFFHKEPTNECIGITKLLYRQLSHKMDDYEVLPFRYADHVIAT